MIELITSFHLPFIFLSKLNHGENSWGDVQNGGLFFFLCVCFSLERAQYSMQLSGVWHIIN